MRLAQDRARATELTRGGSYHVPVHSNPILSFAAASAIAALAATIYITRADELPQNIRARRPNDTILMTFGSKRAIAFYEVDKGRCAVNAVVYEKTDAETGLPQRRAFASA